MNETQHGLIEVEIRLVKRDDEQVARILKARGLPKSKKEIIQNTLKRNIWTTKQLMDLTGYSQSTITNKTRPSYRNGELVTELDFCHPFGDLDGPGPKYIVRNEKSEAILP